MKGKKIITIALVAIVGLTFLWSSLNARGDDDVYFGLPPDEVSKYFVPNFGPENKTFAFYFVTDSTGRPLVGIKVQDNMPPPNSSSFGWTGYNTTNSQGFAKIIYDMARTPTNLTANGITYHFNLPAPPTNGTTHIFYITLPPNGVAIIKDAGYYNLKGKTVLLLRVVNGTSPADGIIKVGTMEDPFYNGMAWAVYDSTYVGNVTIKADGKAITFPANPTLTRASDTTMIGTMFLDLKDFKNKGVNLTEKAKEIYSKHKLAVIGGGILLLLIIWGRAASIKKRNW